MMIEGKKEGIEIKIDCKDNQLNVDKILKMAQASPEILEALQKLKVGEAEPKQNSIGVKSVLFGDEVKKETSPKLEKKLEQLSKYGGEASSVGSEIEEEKPIEEAPKGKKRLTYQEGVNKITGPIAEEFKKQKDMSNYEIDENFTPHAAVDGKSYFDTYSDAESVDSQWFSDQAGVVNKISMEDHMDFVSDAELPNFEGEDWNHPSNRANRYKYLFMKTKLENEGMFQNYFKLMKYTAREKASFEEATLNFEEQLAQKDAEIEEIRKNFEALKLKISPMIMEYEFQVFKRLGIKKPNKKAFHIQVAHIADKKGSLRFFFHNAELMRKLRNSCLRAGIDMGAECLKLGFSETVSFYFIAEKENWRLTCDALIFLFRKLGRTEKVSTESANDMIATVVATGRKIGTFSN